MTDDPTEQYNVPFVPDDLSEEDKALRDHLLGEIRKLFIQHEAKIYIVGQIGIDMIISVAMIANENNKQEAGRDILEYVIPELHHYADGMIDGTCTIERRSATLSNFDTSNKKPN
jgi:hypothetical protein